ncbi:hypothetical protein N7457_000302 [Penicillium paradoxum]|uniref:uncharacterized protein n=1 Tax=Penicillium paradoxum TaxID=176176 RepID=UPI002547932D|nr:uncharacterized protein N7457_000302 [Penicillium paradoxum]KAJ5793703.1 hypothetical protein N7457_000302 [Penicillium paradoxum]
MEDDRNKAVILQLLLEDLESLEDRQKGKQGAGQETDIELALRCMREDVQATQTCIEDQILALSTSTAIATDQKILSSFQHEERVANEDRQLALALDSGTRPPRTTPFAGPGMKSPDDDDDTVSLVMEDLMDRMILNEKPLNGEGSSRVRSSRTHNFMRECASCLDKFDTTVFNGPCGHGFCYDCTRQMFLGAIKDEELYPPRCCGNVVPPGTAMRVLDYEELRKFSERALEWTAQDRLYCADPMCSKFIPAFAIQDQHGTCSECHQQTHLPCRSLAHPKIDCPMDENLDIVLEMADSKHWKRCFNCQTMVELRYGCNHITCR